MSEKSAALYRVVIASWVVLTGLAVYTCRTNVINAWHQSPFTGVLVGVSLLFIAYFWLNGTKDVVYTLCYHLYLRMRDVRLPAVALLRGFYPRVVMVYCTYNDINEESLARCLRQNYPNFWVVILDDSTKPEYTARVDAFAAKYRVPVCRRTDRSGAKAGNLNHFLKNNQDWQYCLILDSDEIIPSNGVSRLLDYFSPGVGIVQGNHHATRNRNPFMERFAPGVNSHWPVYQTVKSRYGFMSLLGHGAMFSRECYQAAGGFPHVVAEDICFSIMAREAGYTTVFAPDVLCEEEFPVDYLAFKKRHTKWTEGNMEFIRKFSRTIFGSRMTWYEKLDIVLFTYSLPLTSLFSLYLVINVFALPLMGFNMKYPLWMVVPTALFLLAPMLNDIIWHWNKMRKLELAAYLLRSTVLFGSMFFVSLRASMKSAFGKSVFHVTPKESDSIGYWEAVRSHWWILACAAVLWTTTELVNGSPLPVVLIAGTAIAALPMIASHHSRTKERKVHITE